MLDTKQITICEVGTRDGFQIEPEFIPTGLKIEAVNRLSAVGIPRLEVTSFVHPKAVPQLRDARGDGTHHAPPGRSMPPRTNDRGARRWRLRGMFHPVLSAAKAVGPHRQHDRGGIARRSKPLAWRMGWRAAAGWHLVFVWLPL